MQSAMLPLISGQKAPEGTTTSRGNPEAPQGLSFVNLLGASDPEGRGISGARNFPGEFSPVQQLNPIAMAPMAQTEQIPSGSPTKQFEFSIPPQTEKVRDSQSYFYAANMDRGAAESQSEPEDTIRSREKEAYGPDQKKGLEEAQQKAQELREIESKQQKKEAARDRELAAREKEEQSRAVEDRSREQEKRAEERVESEKSAAREKAEDRAEKLQVAREKSAQEKGKTSDEVKSDERKEAGTIAGMSGSFEQQTRKTGEVQQSALVDAIMKKALKDAEVSEKGQESKSEKSTQGLWDKLSSLDRPEIKDLREKIQAHPEFEKAMKALKDGKDLESVVQRIVDELDSKDIKNLKELVQTNRPVGEVTVAGNTLGGRQTVDSKWTVEGPALSSEMRVRTDEKASTSGKGGEQQNQQQSRSDGQNLNFRMDSVATANARASAAAEAKEQLPYDRKQFQQMVEQARVRMGSDGRSTAQIRMNPEHLGRMHLDLVMKDNVITGKLVVENQQAFKMIREDIDNLRQELARHGIQLDNLSVKTRESLQSQMQQDNRQSNFQGQNLENGNSQQREGNSPSEKMENTEKYDNEEPTWEERSISDVSESLLMAGGSGRIDLSV
ncbi:MAG: hypothetical protein CMF59_02090 [Leptospiraceae bacterium]|nr:hypothetical protein [Leptospiraceae bacterium]